MEQDRSSTAKLPRHFVSVLIQLRTSHVPLRAYLHRFKLADSSTCDSAPETVAHYILFCNKFATQRDQLASAWVLDLSVLGNRKLRLFPALFKFIKETNRSENSQVFSSPTLRQATPTFFFFTFITVSLPHLPHFGNSVNSFTRLPFGIFYTISAVSLAYLLPHTIRHILSLLYYTPSSL